MMQSISDQRPIDIDVSAMEVGDFMKANALTRSPREKIMLLEAELLQHEQVALETSHTFCDGLYARQIEIPAGTVLTGKIHLREHLNFILKGEIAVFTEHGEQRIKAPAMIVSQPGTKRAGYAVEDTTWCTVHASVSKDVAAVEEELVTNNYEDPRLISVMATLIEEKSA